MKAQKPAIPTANCARLWCLAKERGGAAFIERTGGVSGDDELCISLPGAASGQAADAAPMRRIARVLGGGDGTRRGPKPLVKVGRTTHGDAFARHYRRAGQSQFDQARGG